MKSRDIHSTQKNMPDRTQLSRQIASIEFKDGFSTEAIMAPHNYPLIMWRLMDVKQLDYYGTNNNGKRHNYIITL